MAVAVIMPRQGQSVETCIITEWAKKKNEPVKKGDILFTYETDKASFEAEAEADGILLDVFYNEGDEVPVLQNVAVIGQAGESTASFKPLSAQPVGETTDIPAEKQVETKNVVAEPVIVSLPVQTDGDLRISPRARRKAHELGIDTRTIAGSGPKGRIVEKDILSASLTSPRQTPLSSEVAAQTGLVPPASGTGIGGRVTSFDLVPLNPLYGKDYDEKPMPNIRKLIAKAMVNSLQQSAQLTHHLSADVRKLLAFRKKIKTLGESGQNVPNITLNDMVCYCVVRALKKHPAMNGHLAGDISRTFNKVHLALAVDTPRGLMVPVCRNADDLSLSGLSAQLKSLAEQCKKGNIDPELLKSEAGTFTVSSLGGYGVEIFTPILNIPQVGILGVNTIINRPVDLGDGMFGFAPFMGLSLTYDHRAVDGGPATLFLAEIKREIEVFSYSID